MITRAQLGFQNKSVVVLDLEKGIFIDYKEKHQLEDTRVNCQDQEDLRIQDSKVDKHQ